jgi:hypothetical protein
VLLLFLAIAGFMFSRRLRRPEPPVMPTGAARAEA